METLLTSPLLPANDHALPFRVLFEELLRRRPEELLRYASLLELQPGDEKQLRCYTVDKAKLRSEADLFHGANLPRGSYDTSDARLKLHNALRLQEEAYENLQKRAASIRTGGRSLEGCDMELEACHNADKPLKQILHAIPRSALCLSGGGIRSASFSLGVLEGLARFSRDASADEVGLEVGLMDDLDYLSTVSGGGYIGSWLMSWVWRRYKLNGGTDWKDAYQHVISTLAGTQNPPAPGSNIPPSQAITGGDPEPEPKRHLRSYTSFLAPALGATFDTATLLAIVLRNLFVNWVMLIPLLIAVVSGARAAGRTLLWLQFRYEQTPHGWLSTETLCFLAAALVAAVELPSHDSQRSLGTEGKHPALLMSFRRHWESFQEWFRPAAAPIFLTAVLAGCASLTVAQLSEAKRSSTAFTQETMLAGSCFLVLVASIAWSEWGRLDASYKAFAKNKKIEEFRLYTPLFGVR